jgi:hypothetical protein
MVYSLVLFEKVTFAAGIKSSFFVIFRLTNPFHIPIISFVPKKERVLGQVCLRAEDLRLIFEKDRRQIYMKRAIALSALLGLAAMGAACGGETSNTTNTNRTNTNMSNSNATSTTVSNTSSTTTTVPSNSMSSNSSMGNSNATHVSNSTSTTTTTNSTNTAKPSPTK